jgi:uncharacterized membrane protein
VEKTFVLGRIVFAIGIAAFGILNLVYADPVFGLIPLPSWLAGHAAAAYVTGAIFVASGLCVAANFRVRFAALTLAVVWLAILVALHLPTLLSDVHNGGEWTCAFEALVVFSGAVLLAALCPIGPSDRIDEHLLARAATIARYCFGISLPVFGVLHFVYIDYVASVIPAWIPGHVFFGYFTGCAHIAAGLAIVANVIPRIATILLGTMFASWVLILHIPRVIAAAGNRAEWTSLFVATTLCGSAWLLVTWFARRDAQAKTLTR